MVTKHLFRIRETTAAFADVVRIEQLGLDAATKNRQFAVQMRDGTRLLSDSYAPDDFTAALQQFLAAWESSLESRPAGSRDGVVLQVKKLRPDARLPIRSSDGASCFDLHAVEAATLAPGQRALIKTGLQMAVPRGYEIQVRSRSGHAAKSGVFVLNSPGTVDCDYRGEVGVILHNLGAAPFTIAPGDRVAQIAVCAVEMCPAIEVESLSDTARGAGGFGSTGK